MINREHIDLIKLFKRELSKEGINAYENSNLKNTDYGMLVVMAGIATKFDALYGDAQKIAKTHKVSEIEMKNIIISAFHILLRHYMTEYLNFVNSPLWYERYSVKIGMLPINLNIDS